MSRLLFSLFVLLAVSLPGGSAEAQYIPKDCVYNGVKIKHQSMDCSGSSLIRCVNGAAYSVGKCGCTYYGKARRVPGSFLPVRPKITVGNGKLGYPGSQIRYCYQNRWIDPRLKPCHHNGYTYQNGATLCIGDIKVKCMGGGYAGLGKCSCSYPDPITKTTATASHNTKFCVGRNVIWCSGGRAFPTRGLCGCMHSGKLLKSGSLVCSGGKKYMCTQTRPGTFVFQYMPKLKCCKPTDGACKFNNQLELLKYKKQKAVNYKALAAAAKEKEIKKRSITALKNSARLKQLRANQKKNVARKHCITKNVPWLVLRSGSICTRYVKNEEWYNHCTKSEPKCTAHWPNEWWVAKNDRGKCRWRDILKWVCVKTERRKRLKSPPWRCTQYRRQNVYVPIRKNVTFCFAKENGQNTFYIDGARNPNIRETLRTVANTQWNAAKAAYEGPIKQTTTIIATETAKTVKKVTSTVGGIFSAIERKAKEIANRMANSKFWRDIMGPAIVGRFLGTVWTASSYTKNAIRKKLPYMLRHNKSHLERVVNETKTQKQGSSAYAKLAAISMGLSITLNSAKVALKCQAYSGEAKRVCLGQEIGVALRDTIYDITSYMIMIAVDLIYFEPWSHSLAAAVTGSLAAASMGVGIGAYPIVYLASSFALNISIVFVSEAVLRPEYNKLMQVHSGKLAGWGHEIVKNIPAKDLVCLGGCKKACVFAKRLYQVGQRGLNNKICQNNGTWGNSAATPTPTPPSSVRPTPRPTPTASTTAGKVHQLALAKGWANYANTYTPATYVKQGNIVAVNGLVRGNSWGHIGTLPVGYRPKERMIFNLNNHQYTSRVDVLPNGQIHWLGGGKSYGWISLSGIVFSTATGTNLTLDNRWKNYGHTYSKALIHKEGNIVMVSGLVRFGGWGRIGTLPVGSRPKERLIFHVNNHENAARVDVLPNGQIHWITGGKSHGWISLTGIVFSTAAETKLTFANGWANYGHTFTGAQVTRYGNLAFVSGLIKGTKWGVGMVLLPKDCRPAARIISNANNHQYTSRLDTFPNGYMAWAGGGKNYNWINLSGTVLILNGPAK